MNTIKKEGDYSLSFFYCIRVVSFKEKEKNMKINSDSFE